MMPEFGWSVSMPDWSDIEMQMTSSNMVDCTHCIQVKNAEESN